MAQLINSDPIAALIASLQEMEGINQKADLVAALVGRGITANVSMSMATLTGLAVKSIYAVPANIKKGVAIDGAVGVYQPLPAEYVGKRISLVRAMSTYYPTYDFMTCMTADSNTMYFVCYAAGKHVWKYNVLTGSLTDMGWYSTSAAAICMSDDGSNLYMAEITGALYKWGGSSWVLLPNANVQSSGAYKTMVCNSAGTEIYYFNNVGYICKYVVSTNVVTIISTNLTYAVNSNMLYWCDDNSLWVSYNAGNGTLRNIKISDATVLKTFTATYSLSHAAMNRNATVSVRGSVTERNGSTQAFLAIVNADGSRTVLLTVPLSPEFVVGSLTGKYIVIPLTNNTYNVYQMDVSTTALYSVTPTNFSTVVALSEDTGRMTDTSGNFQSYYLYQ